MARLETENLSVEVGQRRIVSRLNLKLDPGVFLMLTGASGMGKTTLLRTLSGEIAPLEGMIHRSGFSQILFQGHPISESLSTLENVLIGELAKNSWIQTLFQLPKDRVARAKEVLSELNIDPLRKDCRGLSGGEKARVLLARFIIAEPDILFADEPLTGLDRKSAELSLALLKKSVTQRGGSVICVIHDQDLAAKYGDEHWALDHEGLKRQ